MKRLIMKLGLAAAVVLMAGQAYAATNTVTVSGTVVGTCQLSSAASALAFTLDQTLGTPATASANFSMWCTKNVAYTVVPDNGLNFSGGMKNMISGADLIPYTMTVTNSDATPGTGDGKTVPMTITIGGSVANLDYVDAPAGVYGDTVVITVTP